jgi:MYXO-CTERM domain-containing protein
VPQGELVEVGYVLPGGVRSEVYLHDGPFETDVQEQGIEGDVCLELRRRALNGALSEPTTTCGSDLPQVELLDDAAPSCVETGAVALYGGYTTREPGEEYVAITYGYNPEFPDSNPSGDAGCALSLPVSDQVSSSWPLAALLLGALLVRRRR